MIKFGFNTLAMLTYGLGIRRLWAYPSVEAPIKIEFKNKPPGIAIEDKTGPTSFEDGSLSFADESIGFEDR